jgi:hypothetical protein
VNVIKRKELKMDRVHQIKYRGYKINIYQDLSSESPEDWKDENLFLVAYHSDFWVDRIPKELARAIANKGHNEDGETNEEAKEYLKKYHVFGLEAYIHSGIALALSYEGNFPDRQWDVSQLGLVFVHKTEAATRTEARRLALGLIYEWNDNLSGNVYGYNIEDIFGNEKGGCWGFYGDYNESGLIEEAKTEIREALKEDRQLKRIAAQIS